MAWRRYQCEYPPKAAWEMVCLPKSEGGLGVLNVQAQDELGSANQVFR